MFPVVDASSCSIPGVERLDLQVADLAFQAGAGGGVSWTVDYLVQTSGGPAPTQPTVTLIERLTGALQLAGKDARKRPHQEESADVNAPDGDEGVR